MSDKNTNTQYVTPHVSDTAVVRPMPEINIRLDYPGAAIPVYASSGAACFDLVAPEGGKLRPLESKLIDTGVAFEIPEGYVMLVFGRSGHGIRQGVRLANCAGVNDSDYRGTVKVGLTSDNRFCEFEWEAGDRIAQAMIVPAPQYRFNVVEVLSETDRGEGGLGSTSA